MEVVLQLTVAIKQLEKATVLFLVLGQKIGKYNFQAK